MAYVANRKNIRRNVLEAKVLNALREHLMNRNCFKEFCEEFTRQMNRLRMEGRAAIDWAEAEIKRVERELDRFLKLIMASDDEPTPIKMMQQMNGLERRQGDLRTFVATADHPPPLLHPNMALQ